MSKCEVIDCLMIADSWLCEKHRRLLEDPKSEVTVCTKCHSVVKITKKLIKFKRSEQFIYINQCDNCLPWNNK